MATIQERNGSYRILFVYRGKHETFTIGKLPEEIAKAKAAKADELLALLKNGYITVPIGVPITDFIEHEGKPSEAPIPQRESLTLVGHENGHADRSLSLRRSAVPQN